MTTRVNLEPWHKTLFSVLVALLIFAPLFRAGNRPLPLMIIEIAALGLVLVLAWQPRRILSIPLVYRVIGASLLLLPLLYLLPVPEWIWRSVPGREVYATVLESLAVENGLGWRSLSLIPDKTEGALYATLPAVAVFAAVYLLPVEQTRQLVYLLIGIAGVQAALGLMQFGAGPGSPLYFGNPYAANASAAGTYANRDHFAGFLEMVFPITLALLAAKVGQRGRKSRRRSSWRHRIEFVSSMRGHQALIFGAVAVLLVLGLIFTRSRAGVALAMVGLFLSMLAFSTRLGGSNVYGTLGTVFTVVLVLAAEIGLAPVLDRFAQDPLQDSRWTIFATSLDGIGHFSPVGSGAGTFPFVYPLFQPIELGQNFINHAHNDYLEALFEQGIFSLLIMLLGLAVFLRRWPRLMIKGRWGSFRFIQVGAGIGIVLMLLHSLVDFNLHIPANAIFFSVLLAVFLKEYTEDIDQRRRRRTQKRPPEESVPAVKTKQMESWESEGNPFLN